MRIEQPQHRRAMEAKLRWRNFRAILKAARPRLTIIALFLSALCVTGLAMGVAAGKTFAVWRWVEGLCAGPFLTEIFLPWTRWFLVWLESKHARYAEIRGGRVRLETFGQSLSFRPSQLVYCKIEPDAHFDGYYHFIFCVKKNRFLHPRFWSMMIEDVGEAEAFQHELERRAFERA